MKTNKKTSTNGKRPLSIHGRTFIGTVVSDKANKTVKVEWERRRKITKYERYLKLRTRVAAHNPEHINAAKGDIVEIQECRPISKTKHFIITKKLIQDKAYLIQQEHEEEIRRVIDSKARREPSKEEEQEA